VYAGISFVAHSFKPWHINAPYHEFPLSASTTLDVYFLFLHAPGKCGPSMGPSLSFLFRARGDHSQKGYQAARVHVARLISPKISSYSSVRRAFHV
jgi:hypothetical protein